MVYPQLLSQQLPGARGKYSPIPLLSLRAARKFAVYPQLLSQQLPGARGKYSPIPLLSLRSEMIQSITPNRFLIAGVPKQPLIHEILSLRASRKLRSEYNKSIRSPERIFSERRTLTLLCFYAFMKPVIGRLIAHCG